MTTKKDNKAAQAKEDGKRKDSGTTRHESDLKRYRDESCNVNPHQSKEQEDKRTYQIPRHQ